MNLRRRLRNLIYTITPEGPWYFGRYTILVHDGGFLIAKDQVIFWERRFRW